MSARALHLSFLAALTALLLAAPAAGATTKRVRYAVNPETPESTFFQGGGLKLRGSCLGGNLQVLAGSVTDHASLHASSIDAADGGDTHYIEDDDLNRNEFDGLLATLGADGSTGQLVYSASDGSSVTVNWLAEEGDAFGGAKGCAFVGTARTAEKGAADDVVYQAGSNSRPKSFFKGGGLKLQRRCTEPARLHIVLRSLSDHGTVHYGSLRFSVPGYGEDDDFSTGFALTSPLLEGDSGIGQIVYSRPNGPTVTVSWLSEEGDAYGGTRDCAFLGTADVA